jgi:hypothetical protein
VAAEIGTGQILTLQTVTLGSIQYVGVNHSSRDNHFSRDMGMAQQVLRGPDVRASFLQVDLKGMT